MADSGRTIQHRLLLLARDAHAGGHHEAAYHALAAALHAAEDGRDLPTVMEIVREAAAQLAWLDRHLPEHRMSTSSASVLGQAGGYQALMRQAKGWIASAGSGVRPLSPRSSTP